METGKTRIMFLTIKDMWAALDYIVSNMSEIHIEVESEKKLLTITTF